MSNPFATFRKNQNYWMAALVLLAILAFVVAPAIDQAQQALRGGGAENAVVVRWNGGKMTVGDLQIAMQRHGALVRFLNALAREVIEAGGQPKVPGFFYDPQTKQLLGLGIQTASDEQSICNMRILADKAKSIGVEFSDEAIDDFILAYCDNSISTARLAEILNEAGGGRLSNFDVRQLLKQELAAMVVRRTASTGFYNSVPGETYQDFLKINQNATVEAFPVFVDERIDEVTGMPQESEIQAIYDLGSTQIASPDSPGPGFVRPYQANFEFLQLSIQQRMELEKAKLTEEQLRAEYDRMVSMGQLKTQEPPPSGDSPTSNSESPTDQAPSDAAPATPSGEAVDGSSDATAPSSNTPSTTDPAASQPAVEETPPAGSGETSNESSSLEMTPATPATGTPEPNSNDQSRGQRGSSETRFVAFVQEPQSGSETTTSPEQSAQPPAVVEQPADEPPADEPPAGEQAAQPSEQAEETTVAPNEPAAAKAGEQMPPAEKLLTMPPEDGLPPVVEQPEALVPSIDADSLPLSDSLPLTDSLPQLRTQTFEEAREAVAESLAQAAAVQGLDVALRTIYQEVMRPYQAAYRQYAAYRDSEMRGELDPVEEPKRPDLKKLAEEYGLVYGQTGLVDGFKLAGTQFGISEIRQDDESNPGFSGPVVQSAMGPQLQLFQPLQSTYFDRASFQQGTMPEFFSYLFWKTEARDAYVPELTEARPEVVEFWKRQQARQLTEAAAQRLAKKIVVTSDEPWASALTPTEQALIVRTDPFTWISQFGDLQTSTVPRLDRVGEEFMQNVFATNAGGITVAPNQNRNVYYLVRVVALNPDTEELRQRFSADPTKAGPMQLAREESNRLTQGWFEHLYEELGVEWQIQPNQL